MIVAASAVMLSGTPYAAQSKVSDGKTLNTKDMVDIQRTMPAFDAVELSDIADVVYMQGDESSVRIVGTRNLADNLSAEVKDGTLVIAPKAKVAHKNFVINGNERNGSKISYLVVYVTSPVVERISVSSVGSFRCSGTMRSDDLSIKLSGVGSVNLRKVECKRFAVNLSGVGGVESADVSADAANIDCRGAGSLKLTLKDAERVYVSHSGVGNTNVRFAGCGTVKCNMSGVGNMKLSGTVHSFDKSKSGFGTLNADGLKILK